MTNKYDAEFLGMNAANHIPLSPLSFLARSAKVYPDYFAVIHGETRYTWRESYERCIRLASALSKRGIGKGDTVALMAPNVPAAFEAHFGVAMVGAVLNAINIRLDAKTVSFILEHGESKVLITDREFSPAVKAALADLDNKELLVIDIDDPLFEGGELLGEMDYEAFIAEGDPNFDWNMPDNEWDAISLNYTSGTTGNPKGVVCHHRGAYLNAIGETLAWGMAQNPVYLWTLPMFHCNGWCFPWAVAMQGGTNVCLRAVAPGPIYEAFEKYKVTHLCGAPIVMGLLVNATDEERRPLPHTINMMTAGAAPPAAILEKIEQMGFAVTHVYGLTEVYGPDMVCAWKSEWNEFDSAKRAAYKARQGVEFPVLEGAMVADPDTMESVPWDGETIGEVFMRGNIVMKGYLKNEKATKEAFEGGWFHTGDLAVMHPDGYIEIKDRSKDIIISGGENISTIEVEGVLYQHPAVMEASVVAKHDEKWGEVPCAFVTLKPGASATAEEIIQFCRENLAHFKCPKHVVFSELPKTSTGKIQKFVLREQAKAV
ncbi:MAG: acyl-CoA synthetase [Pseudomonadota bacterium]